MNSEAQSSEQGRVPVFVYGSSLPGRRRSPSDMVYSVKQNQQQVLTMSFQLFYCVSVSDEVQFGKVERRW